MNFICSACQNANHTMCDNIMDEDGRIRKVKATTHCDCQHRAAKKAAK